MYPRDVNEGGGPPGSVTVGTTSVRVAGSNMYRKKMTLTNDSDTVIYVAKANDAVLNKGIRLNANGGSVVDEPDLQNYLYTGPWAAISSAATKNLCVQEN